MKHSRKNLITKENFNWCFKKKEKNKFQSPSIEICNIPNTRITNNETYPNCSDCIIKAG